MRGTVTLRGSCLSVCMPLDEPETIANNVALLSLVTALHDSDFVIC